MATLKGTVSYRERMMMRPDSTITVRLLDVSLMDAPAKILAEQKIPAQGKSVPVSFELEYDPRQIREELDYSVSAAIRDGDGTLMWVTDTHNAVLTRGGPTDSIDLMLVSARR